MSKLLFIGAHYDDIELSCGGTIAKMLEQGCKIFYLSFSDCNNKLLKAECKQSIEILNPHGYLLHTMPYRTFNITRQIVLDELIRIRNEYQPDIIFTHSANDRHQDHAVVGAESLRAFRNETLITYTAAWNKIDHRQDNYFVQLTEDELYKKAKACHCYKSQSERSYMYDIELTAHFTGSIIGVPSAESFHIERWMVRNDKNWQKINES